MARRRGFPQARARRKTAWGLGPQMALQSVTTATSVLGTGVQLSAADEVTVVRTRGSILLWLEAATTAGDGFQGALGIGLVTTPAFDIGVTAVPTPLAEEDWDGWLWHQFFHLHAGGPIAAAVSADTDMVNSTTAAVRFEIDSKAMRKFESDMTMIIVMELSPLTGAATLRVEGTSRQLFKLA